MRILVAVHAQVSHTGGGHELLHAFDHAQACAQNRDDGKLASGNRAAGGFHERRLDRDVFKGQVARCLIAFKERKLFDKLAELHGGCVLAAQDGQLVLNKRVVDDGHAR